MSYKVYYKPVAKLRSAHRYRFRRLALTGLFFLLFLTLTYRFFPEIADLVRAVFIPGEDAVTVAAIDQLCRDLRSDNSVVRALKAFLQSLTGGGA